MTYRRAVPSSADTPFFEAEQNWVERSGTDFVAVAAQLLKHAQTKDRFFRSMMKYMKTYQAGIEVAIIRFGHPIRLTEGAGHGGSSQVSETRQSKPKGKLVQSLAEHQFAESHTG